LAGVRASNGREFRLRVLDSTDGPTINEIELQLISVNNGMSGLDWGIIALTPGVVGLGIGAGFSASKSEI